VLQCVLSVESCLTLRKFLIASVLQRLIRCVVQCVLQCVLQYVLQCVLQYVMKCLFVQFHLPNGTKNSAVLLLSWIHIPFKAKTRPKGETIFCFALISYRGI